LLHVDFEISDFYIISRSPIQCNIFFYSPAASFYSFEARIKNIPRPTTNVKIQNKEGPSVRRQAPLGQLIRYNFLNETFSVYRQINDLSIHADHRTGRVVRIRKYDFGDRTVIQTYDRPVVELRYFLNEGLH